MSRKELNDVTITSKFDEASTRENLVSGETIGKHFGKIKKFFSDLKPVAFSGSYSDLSNTPTVDSTLSDTSTNAIQNKAVNSALLKKSNSGHTHDDRYYTETEIDTKLNSKAASSHKHTKSEITDFPTSMPANGGNSSTVNSHTVNSDVPANAKFTDTTYETFTGASSIANGSKGLVPAPIKGEENSFLKADGTWGTPTDTKYNLGSFGVTASATEINYTKGTTSNIQDQINGKAASSHTHDDRYYTETEIDTKLKGKSDTTHSHTTVNGHTVESDVPANAKFTDTNTWNALKGATTSAAGTAGYAPAPSAGAANRYLRSDGTWSVPPDTNTHVAVVDNLTSTATGSALSANQGKVLKGLVDGKADSSHTHTTVNGHTVNSDVPANAKFTDTNTWNALKGATTDADGSAGYAPAPTKGASNRYLRSDGTWAVPPDTNTHVSVVDTLASTDKTAALSANQGKVLKGLVDGKAASSHTHTTVNGHAVNADVPANAKFTDTTYETFTGASSTANGTKGLVPAPTKGNAGLFLRSNGTWGTPTDTNTWRPVVDNLTTTATDQSLSANQGKVLKGLVDGKAASSHTHTKSQITDFPSSLPANGGNSTTVNGHTVNSDVPANAKFTDTNTWNALKGATTSAAGTAGYAPAPAAGAANRYLRSDGTWSVPPDTNTVYSHPTYTAKANGLYKVTVDSTGHVSGTTAVSKSDIVNLGIPGSDTTYETFTGASSTANGTKGLVPAPTKGNDGLFLRSNGTWGTPTDTKYTLGSFGITASATEINYTKGVTSAIQTQLNSKAASNHTHTTINGHTVNSNVPANAKFTDTVVPVIDNLSSTSTTAALSAAQGKELTNIIGSLYSNVVFSTFKFNFTSTFTNNGITFSKLADNFLRLQGTATSNINYNIGSFLFDRNNDKYIYFFVPCGNSNIINNISFELLFSDINDNSDCFPYEIEDEYICIDISDVDTTTKDNTSINIIINSGAVVDITLQILCVPMATNNVKINMNNISNISYSSNFSNTNTIIREICSTVDKIDISAGSSTQPVYFYCGKPVACKYTLGASVPSNAKFTDTVTTIVNSCDSDSTTSALSAAQGKSLKAYIDSVNTNAGNISMYLNSFKQTGVVTCSSTPNTPTVTHVNFATKMSYTPLVFLNPLTAVPGTILKGCSATNITQTGFDIYITRSDGGQTSVKWMAIY